MPELEVTHPVDGDLDCQHRDTRALGSQAFASFFSASPPLSGLGPVGIGSARGFFIAEAIACLSPELRVRGSFSSSFPGDSCACRE